MSDYGLENGEEAQVRGRMVDFFIKDKAEYLKMADGQEIRLDYLQAVNGEEVPKVC